MAITINGSTGITSSEIADSAITSTKIADGTITNADINSSAAIAGTKVDGSFGKVLQVVQDTYTGHTSVASSSYQNILSVTIAPSSASNKVKIEFLINLGMTGGDEGAHIRIYRGATALLLGDARGSRDRAFTHCGAHYAANEQYGASGIYLDSPATTSAQTYYIAVRGHSSGYPIHINSGESDADGHQYSATASVIIVTEIAG